MIVSNLNSNDSNNNDNLSIYSTDIYADINGTNVSNINNNTINNNENNNNNMIGKTKNAINEENESYACDNLCTQDIVNENQDKNKNMSRKHWLRKKKRETGLAVNTDKIWKIVKLMGKYEYAFLGYC